MTSIIIAVACTLLGMALSELRATRRDNPQLTRVAGRIDDIERLATVLAERQYSLEAKLDRASRLERKVSKLQAENAELMARLNLAG